MKFTLISMLFAALATAQDYDLLIRNGRIVDGTGNAAFLGDVGLRQGKIAGMGNLSGKTATRTIDAAATCNRHPVRRQDVYETVAHPARGHL